MARTKNNQAQQEAPQHAPQDSTIVDPRTPTPPSTSAIAPRIEPTNITWINNNGVHFPFSVPSSQEETVVDATQLRSVGIVTSAFLNANSLSHTVKFKIEEKDIQIIKTFVKSGPIASDADGFYWPFMEGIATTNNKDNLTQPFSEVYDGRTKALDDLDDDDSIQVHRIRPGVKVCVEYTPTVWTSRKSHEGLGPKFGSGCTLKLQAVVLLEDGFNFGSPRKRRKLAV